MSKLKRSSGARHLAVPSYQPNNNLLPINVISNGNNLGVTPMAATPVSPAPSPVLSRAPSPALAARSVRHVHMTAPAKHTFNVRNTEQPHHASAFGKQALQTLKVSRRNRSRKNRTRRHTTRRF